MAKTALPSRKQISSKCETSPSTSIRQQVCAHKDKMMISNDIHYMCTCFCGVCLYITMNYVGVCAWSGVLMYICVFLPDDGDLFVI